MLLAVAAPLEHVGPIQEEWDALADHVHAPPWLRPGWVDAWWESFGRGRLELLCSWRDGSLAALLPLMNRSGDVRATSNAESPAFGALARDKKAISEVAGALFSRGARRITLFPLTRGLDEPETYGTHAQAAGFKVLSRTLGRSPFVSLQDGFSVYKKRFNSKFLAEIKRRRKRLEERGRLSLTIEEGADLAPRLQECYELEAAGWKGRRGTAIASRADTSRFYETIARWAADRGWLRLAVLRLDDQALAFDYALEEGGTHYLIKTGYDETHRALAPGVLMRFEMLARCFHAGLHTYEFLGHDEAWKLVWTDTSRELVMLKAFAPSVDGLVAWSSRAYGRPLIRRLRAVTRG
jgi:CelD/BcsL family acetyltransferase involved in cellulose biosynthesis